MDVRVEMKLGVTNWQLRADFSITIISVGILIYDLLPSKNKEMIHCETCRKKGK